MQTAVSQIHIIAVIDDAEPLPRTRSTGCVSQASFTYTGASQTFTVSGNDDTFVFVAGQLIANLGGARQELLACLQCHAATRQPESSAAMKVLPHPVQLTLAPLTGSSVRCRRPRPPERHGAAERPWYQPRRRLHAVRVPRRARRPDLGSGLRHRHRQPDQQRAARRPVPSASDPTCTAAATVAAGVSLALATAGGAADRVSSVPFPAAGRTAR